MQARAAAYAEPTVSGGMNLLRPTGPRTNPNNLLAGGRVIEERVVDINELLATGKLIEAPPVRDQAYRSSATMVSGLAAAPIAMTAVPTAPMYGNVEYITEAVGAPTMVTAPAYGNVEYIMEGVATPTMVTAPAYGNVEYITETVAAPTMVTEFVGAPVQYTAEPFIIQ